MLGWLEGPAWTFGTRYARRAASLSKAPHDAQTPLHFHHDYGTSMARGARSFTADEDRLDLVDLAAEAASHSGSSTDQISPLLHSLQEVAADSGHAEFPARSSTHENQLIHARLGIAGGLFAALRCRHAPTAAHSLRVALGCSAWSEAIKLSAEERDLLEVAALLHDVGKIGVPDRVLFKTGRLLP